MPSRRELWITWAILTGLTVLSLTAGRAAEIDAPPLGVLAVAVLLASALFKASRILQVYLGLAAATSTGWRNGLHGGLVLLAALLLGAYALPLMR